MDKLRNAGLWVWDNKERLLLAVVVVLLIVRLFSIISPAPLEAPELPPAPASNPPAEPGESGPLPEAPDPMPAPPERVERGPLVRANPFSVVSGAQVQEESDRETGESGSDLRVYDVRAGSRGRPPTATIGVGRGRRSRVEEGEEFDGGNYRVERIDVEDEEVSIWVRETRRIIDVSVGR